MGLGSRRSEVADVEPVAEPEPDVAEQDAADVAAESAADESSSTVAPMSKEDRQKALTEVYTEATRQLREAHTDEFNSYRVAGAKARGIEWTPPPTQAEKAKAEIEKLLADNPELAAEFGRAPTLPLGGE